ncbi:hypothetical protein FRB90_001564 [Tulasnella sp. 427]|nr:hypothetical protein FRB90_001564 [Tulasnella sp. 427]
MLSIQTRQRRIVKDALDQLHCAGLARALESQYLMNPSYSTFTDGRLNHIHLPPASPASTSSTSPSPQNEDGSSDSYSRQYSSSLERDGFPDRIFQVMRNDESREVLCSFPKGNYDAKSMGALSHGVSMTPYGHSGDEGFAKTNCTRRLECTRAIPDQRTGGTRKVETLYIPHGQVIFASHRINPEEPKQHYHPYPSPAYETYPTGAGAWQQSNQDDVPHTPSSHSSQDQSLQGYNAPYASSYGRTNTHYSGSWPPTRETPQEWVDSYSSSYAGDQSNRSVLHSRTQQTQSLRSTQSSQSLYPRGSVSTTGLTPSDPRNAVSFSNTNSGFTAQGSYSNYGHSQTGAGHSWAPTTGWEEHSSAPLPPRELHQTSSFRYQDSYPHPQQTQPETPVSAQASYPYFPDNVSTTLRPVRITGARQSPPGLKRSADDMLYSGGSASGSGDERSASPPQSNMLAYGAGAMGYNNGSPPNAQSRSLLPSQRDGGGPRASGNPPPGVTQCVGCGIESSPEWRKGENGVKNLCNAFARSKQKREGIIPQRRKKKDKAPNSTKGRKPVKGKRYGGDSASPPPLMTTPPEEKAQLMDIVEDHENAYRDPSPSFKMPVSSQYAYYDTSNQHRQY